MWNADTEAFLVIKPDMIRKHDHDVHELLTGYE